MITHIVLFQPKAGTTLEEITNALDQVQALQQVIPGIIEVEAGENLSVKHQGYTYGFVMKFVDEEHLRAYAHHPAHRVVSDEFRRICSSIIDFDVGSS